MRRSLLSGWLGLSLVWLTTSARAALDPAWLTPIAPFRIADNLYYVGSQDLASYLIVTQQGDILINSSFRASVSLIRASVEKLGFKFKDIMILLISHSHADHAAGSAQIIHDTGAKYMVMDGDVAVVESGGGADFAYPHDLYPPTRVDRVALQALPCDIFLGAHGIYFYLLRKLQQIQLGSADLVWVDPSGYAAAVLERKAAYETELHQQQSTQ